MMFLSWEVYEVRQAWLEATEHGVCPRNGDFIGFQMISGCNWHDSSNMSWLYHVTSCQDNLEAPMVTYGHLCHRPRFFPRAPAKGSS